MTNREAIEILKIETGVVELDISNGLVIKSENIVNYFDAIDLAIQALEKQEMIVVPKDYVGAEDILAEDWSE